MVKTKSKKEDQILKISLALAEEEEWSGVTINKISEKAGIEENKLLESFPTTKHVVLALIRQVSAEASQSLDPEDSSEPTKDIILHALMCRIEILSRNRDAYSSIFRSLFFNPRDSMFLYPEIMAIMESTLECAGVSKTPLLGTLRKKALAAIYLSALRIWMFDDSPGSAKTMSILDKRLRDAEAIEGFVQKFQWVERIFRQEV